MDTTPSVLIISISNTKPASIIKLITKEAVNNEPKIIKHPFHIKTKYYTTNVNLLGFNDSLTSLGKDASFLKTIEALIIHMDANKANALEDVTKWMKLLDELEIKPEIKLLLTNYCTDSTVITKDCASVWCLNKGFELIELFSQETSQQNTKTALVANTDKKENGVDEELEGAFGPEKEGVDRVIEALENHLWSNMEMNDKDPMSNETKEELEQFFELFGNFMSLKNGITSLPSNVRKQCAEQMVTAFWNAIGGDEDELADS